MTSTAGTGGHPEVCEISALAEGVLPPDRSADLRGHLDGCALCTDVRDSLDEIRDLLGTLPGPPRMPEQVASRIEAALAAEALLSTVADDTVTAEGADPAFAPAGPDTAGQRAAGVAADDVSRETRGSALLLRPLRPGRRMGGAGSGPGGRPGSGPAPRRRPGRRLVAVVGVVVALGLGGVLTVQVLDTPGTPSATPAHHAPVARFSGTPLPARVHQLLRQADGTPEGGAPVRKNTPFTPRTSPVPHCVLAATHRKVSPLATAKGSYRGRASYLLVLPHPADPAKVDAVVVDASCALQTPPDPSVLGKVLASVTYDRG